MSRSIRHVGLESEEENNRELGVRSFESDVGAKSVYSFEGGEGCDAHDVLKAQPIDGRAAGYNDVSSVSESLAAMLTSMP